MLERKGQHSKILRRSSYHFASLPSSSGRVLSRAVSGGPLGQHPDLLQVAIETRGLSREQFEEGIKEVNLLLPSLKPRLTRLSPHVLVQLAEDPASIAWKLAELKRLFPSADVFRIINRRPSLLLDAEFTHVEAAAAKLHSIFPDTDTGELVEQQPLLLLEDVDAALQELKRLFKQDDVVGLLTRDPSLLTAVVSNRKLSIW